MKYTAMTNQINNKKITNDFNIKNISDIETLKSFGSYIEVKKLIENKIGINLKVRSWTQLFEKVNNLSRSIDNNLNILQSFFINGEFKKIKSFCKSKETISYVLSVQIQSRSWVQLEKTLRGLLSTFNNDQKSELFEKNKIRNFINSSKLEGIKIEEVPFLKMEDVLNKYRRR